MLIIKLHSCQSMWYFLLRLVRVPPSIKTRECRVVVFSNNLTRVTLRALLWMACSSWMHKNIPLIKTSSISFSSWISTSSKRTSTTSSLGLLSHESYEFIKAIVCWLCFSIFSYFKSSKCIDKLFKCWIWWFTQHQSTKGFVFSSKTSRKLIILLSLSNGL